MSEISTLLDSNGKFNVELDEMYQRKIKKRVPNDQVVGEGLVSDLGDVYVYLSAVPYCHKSKTLVYFVSGKNGDEFGQYAESVDAKNKARAMAALSKDERRIYDE